jgi:uncharacterized membrane protein
MKKPDPLLSKSRIESLDIVRGLIIVFMALDHCRDFFHSDAFQFNPEDIYQSNLTLFLTRWITHLCAPLFLLLAGIGIYLYQQKNGALVTKKHVMARGLLLIILELTIIQFAWRFTLDFKHISGLVLWVLGWSMLCMPLFLKASTKIIAIISISIISLHNVFDSLQFPNSKTLQVLWSFLHVDDKIFIGNDFYIRILYPLIPAVGIMMLGYGMGSMYTKNFDVAKRKTVLLQMGISSCLAFLLFRTFNLYGDVKLFIVEKHTDQTVMSFLNVSKYPFSLHYCLATLGIGFLLLYVFEHRNTFATRILSIFGKTSLFFYIIHLLFFHTLAGILFILVNKNKIPSTINSNELIKLGYGYPLWTVYIIWLAGCFILYIICAKYLRYKNTASNFITKWI